VLGGGKAMVFVDPYCDNDAPPPDPNNPMQQYQWQRGSVAGMTKLFDAWGVQMPPDKIAADRQHALRIPWNSRGQRDMVPYVAFLGLNTDCVNKDEVTTSQLHTLNLAYAGVVEPKTGATTTFTPLLHTGPESMEIATSLIQFAPDPSKLLADFFPTNQQLTLAARITGPAKTAFPEGKPKAAEPDAPPPTGNAPHLTDSNGPIHVIVVGDVDMLSDPFWVNVVNFAGQRIPDFRADNGAFVLNTLDFLHGSTDMVSLRARGRSTYPFLVVQELQRTAEQSFRAEEQKLIDEREKTERRLDELLSKKDDANATLMSPEAQAEISKLRDQMVATNKRLREVRHDLNKDIEWLGVKLKFLNVGIVPGLVLVAALLVFFYRQNRRKLA
jgi:ABC-type uncharacterized transport system involved in gliding motility auxiliary subunit